MDMLNILEMMMGSITLLATVLCVLLVAQIYSKQTTQTNQGS